LVHRAFDPPYMGFSSRDNSRHDRSASLPAGGLVLMANGAALCACDAGR
jgi:hypothetical protein